MSSANTSSLSSRYQFKFLLGEGGAGQVFTAWDNHLRRTVAIKQIKVGNLEGNDVRDTWQEAMCLATLRHSNIVTIYDLGMDGETPYIVMEYIQGETLERTVETSPLDTATFIEIARQCLDGLSSAHHAGLIHRDLKPANIMLCRLPSGSYQVKILDFGIASFIQDGNPEETKTDGSISGSIHWIAPEQIEGYPATEQSDLYSLGCLFYFALTGFPPFTAKSTEDIANAHLEHTVKHLSELRKDLPSPLTDWIMGLIARNPSERPTRATEALEDFEVITGRRQLSTRAMKLPTIPLEPSEVPVGDSTCSFNFNQIAAAPSVTKPNDPAPQSVPSPSLVARKADSKQPHWLVWMGCAAILALAGLAWFVTGSKSEPKKTATTVAAGVPILRLHGSNTVGSKMGPSLIQGFLQTKGASQIHTEQGSMPVERRITFLLPKDSVPSLVEVHSHGSRTGFASLANGTCDIAMSSNEVKDEMHEELSNKGIGDMRTPACEHVIGLDGLAVIIHSTNSVSRLSKDQIAAVFSGAIRDWSQLGREKGGPIRLYARDANSGTFESFQAMVLGNKTLNPEARRIEDSTELSEGVSNDPDGMGFVGLPYIKNCKAVAVGDGECAPLIPTPFTVATEDYALSRRLYFYSPSTPSHPWVRELVEFSLGTAGQEIVSNSGFIKQSIDTHRINVPSGAPEQYVALSQGAERLSLSLRFNSSESQLDTKASRDLDRLVAALLQPRFEKSQVLLIGFSDDSGDASKDIERSKKFVEMVSSELEMRGVKAQAVEGVGAVLPIASNTTKAGRAKNRRVEVWIKNPGI
jgi:phosphate transport system substrate-binding protein